MGTGSIWPAEAVVGLGDGEPAWAWGELMAWAGLLPQAAPRSPTASRASRTSQHTLRQTICHTPLSLPLDAYRLHDPDYQAYDYDYMEYMEPDQGPRFHR